MLGNPTKRKSPPTCAIAIDLHPDGSPADAPSVQPLLGDPVFVGVFAGSVVTHEEVNVTLRKGECIPRLVAPRRPTRPVARLQPWKSLRILPLAGLQVRPPRKAGGLMSWAASKAVDLWVPVARCAPERLLGIIHPCSRTYWRTCSKREPDGGHRVAVSPEVLSEEVPLLAAQPGNRDGALPLQKSITKETGYLGGFAIHMVWHQVPLNDWTLFLLGQRMENRPELLADRAEDGFPRPLRDEHDLIFAVPIMEWAILR